RKDNSAVQSIGRVGILTSISQRMAFYDASNGLFLEIVLVDVPGIVGGVIRRTMCSKNQQLAVRRYIQILNIIFGRTEVLSQHLVIDSVHIQTGTTHQLRPGTELVGGLQIQGSPLLPFHCTFETFFRRLTVFGEIPFNVYKRRAL